MNTYQVTIEATITRTITVEAQDADTAYNLAHEQDFFTNDAIRSASWNTLNILKNQEV